MVYVQFKSGFVQGDLTKLEKIAEIDDTSIAQLLREAAKDYIRKRLG